MKTAPTFFFRLKAVLDVLGKEGDLIHRGLPTSKTRLLPGEVGVYDGFDTGVDQALEEAQSNEIGL